MFAVIKTGGKQYRVAAGDEITVEKLPAEPGQTVELDQVLMLGGDAPAVGTPLVEGAAVRAEVVEQTRGPKVVSFKKRRRKHGSKRIKGHRQHLTVLRVTEIVGAGGAKPAAKTKKAAKKAPATAESAAGTAAEAGAASPE